MMSDNIREYSLEYGTGNNCEKDVLFFNLIVPSLPPDRLEVFWRKMKYARRVTIDWREGLRPKVEILGVNMEVDDYRYWREDTYKW